MKIATPATGVLPGNGGLVNVIADIDLADWTALRGAELPADYDVFDFDPSIDISGDSIPTFASIPATMYCYVEDSGVDNPTRGYIEVSVPWGGAIGPWTGIAAIMRTSGGITFNGGARPIFGGDRITLVGADFALTAGTVVPRVAGVRIDQNLFTVLGSRLQATARELVWDALNDAIEGTSADERWSLSMKKVAFNPTVTMTLSPAGGGRLHVDADFRDVEIRVSVADPPWPCADFDAIVVANRIRVVGDLDFVMGTTGVSVNVNNLDTIISGLRLTTNLNGICGIPANAVGDLVSAGVHTWDVFFGDRIENNVSDVATTLINDKLTKLNAKLNLTFNSLAADATGLVAIYDGIVPPTGIVISVGDNPLVPLNEVLETQEINGQAIDVGLYVTPVAISLMASGISGPIVSTSPNGFAQSISLDVAPYAFFDGTNFRFTAPGARLLISAPALAPVPGRHLLTVTDFRGFGDIYPEIDPVTGEFAMKLGEQPTSCAALCPTSMLWATTKQILVPLGHAPNLVGGSMWKSIKEKLNTPLGKFTRLGDPINLELALVAGQGVGANSQGYFAIYGYVRELATVDISGLSNMTTTQAPWTTGLYIFSGQINYTTSGFVGPFTVTATARSCTHNPPSLVVYPDKVTYSMTIYLGQGGGLASCYVDIKATSTSGQVATDSYFVSVGV